MHQIQEDFRRNMEQMDTLRHLNVFITENVDSASEKIKISAERRLRNDDKGPLDGITFSVKDNICVEGIRMTCGSKALKDYMPHCTATAVERLLDSGSILVGKTNMDEFGMGVACLNSSFGRVHHPLSVSADKSLITGGSSGGSAASVAAGMCSFSLGTDTGGSVRLPASFCNLIGLKPTFGRVSHFGLVPYANSMDTIGILSKDLATCAQVLDVVSGWDSKDVTLSHDPHVTCADKLSDFKSGIRIGLLKGYLGSVKCVEYCSTIDEAARHFEHQGASIKEIEMTEFFNCVPAYYILCSTEAAGNMSEYRRMVNAPASQSACDIGHAPPDEWMEELRESTRSRLTIGQSSHFPEGKAQYKAATQTRRNMVKQFREVFEEVDLVLTPTTIGPPLSTEDYLALDTAGSGALVTFTCPVNMCGLPAISIPFGRTKGNLPLGVQLIANHFQEHSLLQAAHFLLSCMRV